MRSKVSKRVLQPGEPVPPWPPYRYMKREGYVELRWLVAPGQYVWCYEHRLVHGLPEGKQVHHKNRVRDDNDPTNLTPLTPAAHGAEHRRLDYEVIVRLYREGQHCVAIARRFGTDPARVWRILTAAGEPIRPRGTDGPRKKLDEAEVVRLFMSGVRPKEIGRMMGCSDGPIRRIVAEAGIPPHRAGNPRLMRP